MSISHTRILSIKTGSIGGDAFIDWLIAFRFDDLIECPQSPRRDFRTAKGKDCSRFGKRILNLLRDIEGCVNPMCPTVCSGLRGDGSRFRETCKFFMGYGARLGVQWNFSNPDLFVRCRYREDYKVTVFKAASCKRREIARTVAHEKGLIESFGSASLTYALSNECQACSFRSKEGCSYIFRCERAGLYSVMSNKCNWGDCATCPVPRRRRSG